jgi:type II secretory pathway pseudopilin PulG
LSFRFQATVPACDRRGFTLVELLLSILIAVLVVSLLGSIFMTSARTAAGQEERRHEAPAALELLERVRDDLARAILPAEDDACGLVLAEDPWSLSFCTLRPSPTDTDFRWAVIWRVEYRMEPDEAGGARLVSVEHPAVGPASAAPATNVLIAGIDRFDLALYDGATWNATWPPESGRGRPLAARVELVASRFKGQQEWQAEILIPAGMVVTSRVTRALAAP